MDSSYSLVSCNRFFFSYFSRVWKNHNHFCTFENGVSITVPIRFYIILIHALEANVRAWKLVRSCPPFPCHGRIYVSRGKNDASINKACLEQASSRYSGSGQKEATTQRRVASFFSPFVLQLATRWKNRPHRGFSKIVTGDFSRKSCITERNGVKRTGVNVYTRFKRYNYDKNTRNSACNWNI